MPTLLTWPGSAIVHDIKGENWELTTGWRALRVGAAVRSDEADSTAYNPLLEVRRGEGEVRDVQNIADGLVDPEGALKHRNHREKTRHSLLVGAILHVVYAEPDKTLPIGSRRFQVPFYIEQGIWMRVREVICEISYHGPISLLTAEILIRKGSAIRWLDQDHPAVVIPVAGVASRSQLSIRGRKLTDVLGLDRLL